jgi:hypothetical protein
VDARALFQEIIGAAMYRSILPMYSEIIARTRYTSIRSKYRMVEGRRTDRVSIEITNTSTAWGFREYGTGVFNSDEGSAYMPNHYPGSRLYEWSKQRHFSPWYVAKRVFEKGGTTADHVVRDANAKHYARIRAAITAARLVYAEKATGLY